MSTRVRRTNTFVSTNSFSSKRSSGIYSSTSSGYESKRSSLYNNYALDNNYSYTTRSSTYSSNASSTYSSNTNSVYNTNRNSWSSQNYKISSYSSSFTNSSSFNTLPEDEATYDTHTARLDTSDSFDRPSDTIESQFTKFASSCRALRKDLNSYEKNWYERSMNGIVGDRGGSDGMSGNDGHEESPDKGSQSEWQRYLEARRLLEKACDIIRARPWRMDKISFGYEYSPDSPSPYPYDYPSNTVLVNVPYSPGPVLRRSRLSVARNKKNTDPPKTEADKASNDKTSKIRIKVRSKLNKDKEEKIDEVEKDEEPLDPAIGEGLLSGEPGLNIKDWRNKRNSLKTEGDDKEEEIKEVDEDEKQVESAISDNNGAQDCDKVTQNDLIIPIVKDGKVSLVQRKEENNDDNEGVFGSPVHVNGEKECLQPIKKNNEKNEKNENNEKNEKNESVSNSTTHSIENEENNNSKKEFLSRLSERDCFKPIGNNTIFEEKADEEKRPQMKIKSRVRRDSLKSIEKSPVQETKSDVEDHHPQIKINSKLRRDSLKSIGKNKIRETKTDVEDQTQIKINSRLRRDSLKSIEKNLETKTDLEDQAHLKINSRLRRDSLKSIEKNMILETKSDVEDQAHLKITSTLRRDSLKSLEKNMILETKADVEDHAQLNINSRLRRDSLKTIEKNMIVETKADVEDQAHLKINSTLRRDSLKSIGKNMIPETKADIENQPQVKIKLSSNKKSDKENIQKPEKDITTKISSGKGNSSKIKISVSSKTSSDKNNQKTNEKTTKNSADKSRYSRSGDDDVFKSSSYDDETRDNNKPTVKRSSTVRYWHKDKDTILDQLDKDIANNSNTDTVYGSGKTARINPFIRYAHNFDSDDELEKDKQSVKSVTTSRLSMGSYSELGSKRLQSGSSFRKRYDDPSNDSSENEAPRGRFLSTRNSALSSHSVRLPQRRSALY